MIPYADVARAMTHISETLALSHVKGRQTADERTGLFAWATSSCRHEYTVAGLWRYASNVDAIDVTTVVHVVTKSLFIPFNEREKCYVLKSCMDRWDGGFYSLLLAWTARCCQHVAAHGSTRSLCTACSSLGPEGGSCVRR